MTEKPSLPLLAWRVEINSMVCVTFAATREAASWLAVKSYWEAFGRSGRWPSVCALRAPEHDGSGARLITPQRAWTEDYVLDRP